MEEKILYVNALRNITSKFPQPLGSPLELLPSEEGTLTGFKPRSGPAGGITLPIAPKYFTMTVLKTFKFLREGIEGLDIG